MDKDAEREYKHQWYLAHRAETLKKDAKWREAHPEKMREYQERYYATNRDLAIERARKWREANRSRFNEQNRAYYERNRTKILKAKKAAYDAGSKRKTKGGIYSANRRANQAANGGKLTEEDLKAQFELQDGKCFYCGVLLFASFETSYEIEHKVPISKGGSSDISNVVLSCRKCNRRKHAKTDAEFLKSSY